MWKNKSAKITRVSRFVNSIRESSNKHGDSLVVQTGFPTSLIDLIVKNRDCLNKSSSKKKKIKTRFSKEIVEYTPTIFTHQNLSSTTLTPFILNSLNELLIGETETDCEVHKDNCDSAGKDICVLNYNKHEENEDIGVRIRVVPIRNKVFVIVIKIFVILMLALGTKKLAIGITLFAFLLLFVEFLLKNSVVSINLEERGIGVVENLVTDVDDLKEEFQKMIKKGNDFDKVCQFYNSDKEERNLKDCESLTENAIVETPRRTTSATLRAKWFKKYMVKKFKGKKINKEGKLDSSNAPLNCTLEKINLSKTWEEQENDDDDEDHDAEEVVIEEYDFSDISEVSSDKGFQDNLETTTNWNWRNLIPAVIILAGLVWGRTMALVLIVVWILLVGVTKRLTQGSKKLIWI